MNRFKLHEKAIQLALERGEIDYINFAKIADIHPSYASQVLAEAARLDSRVIYYKGILYSASVFRDKRLAELTRRLSQ